ncbi:thermonuclease family protein [Mariniflexile maritimum]|uniref:thermonuclease family protein n=1 Tax=Mariniflexile maritimum TaxID=2682493 RepID=UPI0012F6A29A|nr:thermonuclease family protein [Mariniflexile maritimum]
METITIKNLLRIVKYVDGDGIILEDIISKNEFEVRFLGIDAPEMKYCNKVKKDEKELNIPAELLIKLGYASLDYLKKKTKVGEFCTLIQEKNNLKDKYGRYLGYLVLENGKVLNEIMVENGYAKPYNEVFCEMLPKYQELFLKAKSKKKGLFKIINNF